MPSGNLARAASPLFRSSRLYPRWIKLPTPQGSYTTGNRVRVQMPLGVTYHSIGMRFTIAGTAATSAQIKAQVAHVRATIDGDDKIANATATELIAIMDCWGSSRNSLGDISDGCLVLSIARQTDMEISAQDGPAWGCAVGVEGGVGNFTFEIEFGGTTTIDNVDMWAEVTNAEPLGRHWALKRYPLFNAQTSGDVQFADFIQDPTWGVYALHLDKGAVPEGSAPITDIKLVVDQVAEVESIKCGMLEAMYRRWGITKQTGFTHIPFARRGRPLDCLPLVAQDMRLTLTVGAALNTFNILAEQLQGVDPQAA